MGVEGVSIGAVKTFSPLDKKQCSAIKRTRTMSSLKARMTEINQEQPEDATHEEIMRELAFECMVERGLVDSRTGRVIPNEEMARRIRTWQK